METKNVELKILTASILAVLAVEGALILLDRVLDVRPLLLLGGARIVQIALVLFLAAYWGQGLASLGLGPGTIRPGLKSGLVWSACFGLAAGLVLTGAFLVGFDPQPILGSALPKDYLNLFLYFLVGGIIAPVAEEIFFRGVIFGFFRPWGATAAVAMSTSIFTLLHLVKTPLPLTQLVGGLVFALAYESSKSLMTPIAIHALGNLALFGLALGSSFF